MINEILINLSLPFKTYIIYSLAINCISFGIMAYDKYMAVKQQHRVPEITLLLLALLGGATGTLISMAMLHHKISKRKFYFGVPLLLVVNKIVDFLMLYYI